MSVAELEVDLDVFTGPFDLLLALVLREEVDLLEVPLADVVLAYLDHLESRDELELEQATEFLVLVAALLELKSRLMLPREEEELLDLDPGEAAEELLARMLEAKRYRAAADDLRARLEAQHGVRYRSAAPPSWLRRPDGAGLRAVYEPGRLGSALAALLRPPPEVSLRHVTIHPVTVAERLDVLRRALARGTASFDDAVRGADRVTVAVTVWALLELYRRGEATWEQSEPFGEITIVGRRKPTLGSERAA